jgi:hypothetical protein
VGRQSQRPIATSCYLLSSVTETLFEHDFEQRLPNGRKCIRRKNFCRSGTLRSIATSSGIGIATSSGIAIATSCYLLSSVTETLLEHGFEQRLPNGRKCDVRLSSYRSGTLRLTAHFSPTVRGHCDWRTSQLSIYI